MSLTSIVVGLVFVVGGLSAIARPRIQGARDADLITASEVGDAERWGAYAGGSVLVLLGTFFIYLGI